MNRISWRKTPYEILAIVILLVSLAGCSPAIKTGSGSPSILTQSVSVFSNGKEASQKVTVTLTFDRAITIVGNVDNQLAVKLNGKSVDTKTMAWHAAADKNNREKLICTLSALPSDTDPMQGRYFAVYEGSLVITAKNGASVAAITDSSRKYAAKWAKVHVQIPSGVTVVPVSSENGSVSAPAQVTVRVTSTGVIRAMTWVQFLQNGQPVMQKDYKKGSFSYTNDGSFPIHDHQLFQMNKEDYAKEIASGLESYFGKGTPTAGEYSFITNKDTVMVKANASTDGEILSLCIFNHPDS
ncbi:hypothetical protein [Ethanoligenens sp.]|uniref:hypothetical protein n=1 Tax=Ethanoligenens sp. TaxID=2099655 RepID=UPI0039EC278B